MKKPSVSRILLQKEIGSLKRESLQCEPLREKEWRRLRSNSGCSANKPKLQNEHRNRLGRRLVRHKRNKPELQRLRRRLVRLKRNKLVTYKSYRRRGIASDKKWRIARHG